MTADVEWVAGELSGQLGAESAVDVQFGDLGSSTGEHHRVVALCPSGPPVGDQERLRVGRRVADGDAAVVAVGVEGERRVAVAELLECFAFPFLVLASVVAEFDRGLPRDESGEQSAGCDLGELLRVADEHDLGAASVDLVEDGGEVAGAGGAGFVDDEHGAVVESAGFVVVDGDAESGDRGRRDAGGVGDLVGGDAGVGCAAHPVAGSFPCFACGREGEGLAGSGGCGEDVDAVAGCRHADHCRSLFFRQRRRASQRGEQILVVAHGGVAVEESRARGRAHSVRC